MRALPALDQDDCGHCLTDNPAAALPLQALAGGKHASDARVE
jgi:hypothetical protein